MVNVSRRVSKGARQYLLSALPYSFSRVNHYTEIFFAVMILVPKLEQFGNHVRGDPLSGNPSMASSLKKPYFFIGFQNEY
jgi:hypothetical protein